MVYGLITRLSYRLYGHTESCERDVRDVIDMIEELDGASRRYGARQTQECVELISSSLLT